MNNKDEIARMITDKVNILPISKCVKKEQQSQWFSVYMVVLNILAELEKMSKKGLCQIKYEGGKDER